MGISACRIWGLAETYHARWVNPAATCGMAFHLIHNLSSARLVAAKWSNWTKSLSSIRVSLQQKTEGAQEDSCRNIPGSEMMNPFRCCWSSECIFCSWFCARRIVPVLHCTQCNQQSPYCMPQEEVTEVNPWFWVQRSNFPTIQHNCQVFPVTLVNWCFSHLKNSIFSCKSAASSCFKNCCSTFDA